MVIASFHLFEDRNYATSTHLGWVLFPYYYYILFELCKTTYHTYMFGANQWIYLPIHYKLN